MSQISNEITANDNVRHATQRKCAIPLVVGTGMQFFKTPEKTLAETMIIGEASTAKRRHGRKSLGH